MSRSAGPGTIAAMRSSALAAAVLSLLLSSAALAWNKPGHMVTGAIAYDLLKREHPQALARVLDLLRQHPQYADIWANRLDAVPPENRDRYLFMIAARWADDIRDNRTYHRGPWHYVNFPIVAPADEGRLTPPEPAPENILSAITENRTVLDSERPAGEKAVALAWLFHLVGDVHQPLHATAYFSSDQWPKGDKGGNDFHVRVKPDRAVVNLHSLWDGLILGSQSYQAVSNEAIRLRNRPEFARAKLAELEVKDPEQWARESYRLAVEVAYQNRTLRGGTDRSDGPVLPNGYTDAAKAAAERRIVLAGYRLADVLKSTGRADQ